MSTSLLAQTESENFVILCKCSPRNAANHATAYEKARKAYLRAVYGYQPVKGEHLAIIQSVTAEGSVMVVEIRFFVGEKVHQNTFELPLYVFKKDGVPLTSTATIEEFTGYFAHVTVIDRYKFDGISLSIVGEIDRRTHSKASECASVGVASK
jgi:hypothetical protein